MTLDHEVKKLAAELAQLKQDHLSRDCLLYVAATKTKRRRNGASIDRANMRREAPMFSDYRHFDNMPD
jgi:hypothetical protein